MQDLFSSRRARPMLIGAIEKPFDDKDSLFELKLDGERCLAYLDHTGTVLANRRDFSLLPRLPELAGLHRQVSRRCILDGEIITGTGGRENFEVLRARLARQGAAKIRLGAGRHPACFVVFDMLYHGDGAVTARPLTERKALLAQTVTESERMTLARTVDGDGRAFYELVARQGLEGVVGKKKHSLYYPGRRTREWVKVKNTLEDDCVICGYALSAHVATLMLGQYDTSGALVCRGRVALDLHTPDFGAVRRVPRAARCPFTRPPPEKPGESPVWLRPRLVCTVQFIRRTESGLMRQPHYRGLRPDKAPQEAIVTGRA